jgi:hypothetical protein
LNSPEKRVLAHGEVADPSTSSDIALMDQSDIALATATHVVLAPENAPEPSQKMCQSRSLNPTSIRLQETEFILEGSWAEEKQVTDKQILSLIRKLHLIMSKRNAELQL